MAPGKRPPKGNSPPNEFRVVPNPNFKPRSGDFTHVAVPIPAKRMNVAKITKALRAVK